MACPLQPLEFQGKEYRHKLSSEDRLLWKESDLYSSIKATGMFLVIRPQDFL